MIAGYGRDRQFEGRLRLMSKTLFATLSLISFTALGWSGIPTHANKLSTDTPGAATPTHLHCIDHAYVISNRQFLGVAGERSKSLTLNTFVGLPGEPFSYESLVFKIHKTSEMEVFLYSRPASDLQFFGGRLRMPSNLRSHLYVLQNRDFGALETSCARALCYENGVPVVGPGGLFLDVGRESARQWALNRIQTVLHELQVDGLYTDTVRTDANAGNFFSCSPGSPEVNTSICDGSWMPAVINYMGEIGRAARDVGLPVVYNGLSRPAREFEQNLRVLFENEGVSGGDIEFFGGRHYATGIYEDDSIDWGRYAQRYLDLFTSHSTREIISQKSLHFWGRNRNEYVSYHEDFERWRYLLGLYLLVRNERTSFRYGAAIQFNGSPYRANGCGDAHIDGDLALGAAVDVDSGYCSSLGGTNVGVGEQGYCARSDGTLFKNFENGFVCLRPGNMVGTSGCALPGGRHWDAGGKVFDGWAEVEPGTARILVSSHPNISSMHWWAFGASRPFNDNWAVEDWADAILLGGSLLLNPSSQQFEHDLLLDHVKKWEPPKRLELSISTPSPAARVRVVAEIDILVDGQEPAPGEEDAWSWLVLDFQPGKPQSHTIGPTFGFRTEERSHLSASPYYVVDTTSGQAEWRSDGRRYLLVFDQPVIESCGGDPRRTCRIRRFAFVRFGGRMQVYYVAVRP
jgi:hypothetical protein